MFHDVEFTLLALLDVAKKTVRYYCNLIWGKQQIAS